MLPDQGRGDQEQTCFSGGKNKRGKNLADGQGIRLRSFSLWCPCPGNRDHSSRKAPTHLAYPRKSKIKGPLLHSVTEVSGLLTHRFVGEHTNVFKSAGVGWGAEPPTDNRDEFQVTQELKYSSGYPESQSNSTFRATESGVECTSSRHAHASLRDACLPVPF